jgi:hypothetical protein
LSTDFTPDTQQLLDLGAGTMDFSQHCPCGPWIVSGSTNVKARHLESFRQLGEVKLDLLTQLALEADAGAVTDDEHPQHHLGINRWTTDLAVERPCPRIRPPRKAS